MGSLLWLKLYASVPASGSRTARCTITKDVEIAHPNQANPFYSKGKLMLTQTLQVFHTTPDTMAIIFVYIIENFKFILIQLLKH